MLLVNIHGDLQGGKSAQERQGGEDDGKCGNRKDSSPVKHVVRPPRADVENRGHHYADRRGIEDRRHDETSQETLDVLAAEVRKLYDGITDDEINRLKGRIKRALIIQQESSPSRAGSIALDWYYLSRVRPLAELSQIIDNLSAQSINRYLAANVPREMTVCTVGPEPLVWKPN